MSEELTMPRQPCGTCGKPVPVRDIRNKKPVYCNRVHAAAARQNALRYHGTNSGPADRPNIADKMKRV